MKEQILKLRNEGKTYNEIKEIVGCSKGTISYYCNPTQKEKVKIRTQKIRSNPIVKKVENFKYGGKSYKRKKKLERIRGFQKTDYNIKNKNNRKINKNIQKTFNWQDVLEKFGENTKCYLTGESINLYDDNCSFDHIVPVSKDGSNDMDNLGITHKISNQMKGNLSVDELMIWCKKILENNGYKVNKIK